MCHFNTPIDPLFLIIWGMCLTDNWYAYKKPTCCCLDPLSCVSRGFLLITTRHVICFNTNHLFFQFRYTPVVVNPSGMETCIGVDDVNRKNISNPIGECDVNPIRMAPEIFRIILVNTMLTMTVLSIDIIFASLYNILLPTLDASFLELLHIKTITKQCAHVANILEKSTLHGIEYLQPIAQQSQFTLHSRQIQ